MERARNLPGVGKEGEARGPSKPFLEFGFEVADSPAANWVTADPVDEAEMGQRR